MDTVDKTKKKDLANIPSHQEFATGAIKLGASCYSSSGILINLTHDLIGRVVGGVSVVEQ